MMKTSEKPLDLLAAVIDWHDVQAEAKEGEGDAAPKKLRRFSMTAYSGGVMNLPGWKYPVVVDLEGLAIASQSRPILRDHNRGQIVGHTDSITIEDYQLKVTGVISGVGEAAQEVIASSENGFPWQASIGARGDKMVLIPAGRQVMVNGQTFSGPLYVARQATLGEISFVAIAADQNTTVRVAAGARADNHSHDTETSAMDFEKWLQAQGFEPDQLNEDGRYPRGARRDHRGRPWRR